MPNPESYLMDSGLNRIKIGDGVVLVNNEIELDPNFVDHLIHSNNPTGSHCSIDYTYFLEINNKLNDINSKLNPKVITNIIEKIIIKKDPIFITKLCNKYITKTIENIIYIDRYTNKVIENIILPPIETIEVDCCGDCYEYTNNLIKSMKETYQIWISKPNKPPYSKWSLATYCLSVKQGMGLSRPSSCKDKKIVSKVFGQLYPNNI